MTERTFNDKTHAAILASVTDGGKGQTFNQVLQASVFDVNEETSIAHGLNNLIAANGGPIAMRATHDLFVLMHHARHVETVETVLTQIDTLSRARSSDNVDTVLVSNISQHMEDVKNGDTGYDSQIVSRLSGCATHLSTHGNNAIRYHALLAVKNASAIDATKTQIADTSKAAQYGIKMDGLTP